MDGLFTFLLIVFAVVKFLGKNNKSKTQKVAKRFSNLEERLEEMFGMESSAPAASMPKAATVQSRPAPARRPAAEISMAQPTRTDTMEGRSVPKSVPSQKENTSGEGHSRNVANRWGSLPMDSQEGVDICDPALGHDDHRIGCDVHDAMEPLDQFDTERTPSLDLNWNRESIVRAVVMNEILTRPSQRMIRRG